MQLHIKKVILFYFIFGLFNCNTKSPNVTEAQQEVKAVNSTYFNVNHHVQLDTVDCVLTNGIKSKCLQITTMGTPTDHEIGPWCPETITDSANVGGLWFENGKMHSVDGKFIENLAEFYDDENWLLYDENGNVHRTDSKEDCIKLAGARLVDEFTNYCIECLPEYVVEKTKKFTIPLQPIMLKSPTMLRGGAPPNDAPENGRKQGPPPDSGGPKKGPEVRGIALNGIAFDAPAPTQLILSGYTIPPLDHAGGHINMDAGYHYHAATGLSKEIAQEDGHAPLLGYAMDGIGLYAHLSVDGSEPKDLNQCRGHYDDTRGYHYHVDASGQNNFVNCFSGATVE